MNKTSKNWKNFLIQEARADSITSPILTMVMRLIRNRGFKEMEDSMRTGFNPKLGAAPVRFVLGKPKTTTVTVNDIHFFSDGFEGIMTSQGPVTTNKDFNNQKYINHAEGDIFNLDAKQRGAEGQTSAAGRSLVKALRETDSPLDIIIVTLHPVFGKTNRPFVVGAKMIHPNMGKDMEAFIKGEESRGLSNADPDPEKEVTMEIDINVNMRAIKSQFDMDKALNDLLLQLKQAIAHEVTHNFQAMRPKSDWAAIGNTHGITKQIKSLITNELIPDLPEGLGFLVTPYEVEALIRGLYVYSRASKIPLEDIIDAYFEETTLNKLEGGGLATHHGLNMSEKEAFDFIKNEVKPRWIDYLKAQLPCAIMSNGKPVGKCVEYDGKTGKKSEKVTKGLKLGLSNEKIGNMLWGDAIKSFSKKTGRKKSTTSSGGSSKSAPTTPASTTSVAKPSTGQFGKKPSNTFGSSTFKMPKGL
jgi:hypothetical protein